MQSALGKLSDEEREALDKQVEDIANNRAHKAVEDFRPVIPTDNDTAQSYLNRVGKLFGKVFELDTPEPIMTDEEVDKVGYRIASILRAEAAANMAAAQPVQVMQAPAQPVPAVGQTFDPAGIPANAIVAGQTAVQPQPPAGAPQMQPGQVQVTRMPAVTAPLPQRNPSFEPSAQFMQALARAGGLG